MQRQRTHRCALQERAFREKLKSVQEEKVARRAAKAASSPRRKVEHMTDEAYVQLFKLMISSFYGSPHLEPSAAKAPTAMLGALKVLGAPLRRGMQQRSSPSPYGIAAGGGGRARSFANENALLAKDIVRWALTTQTKLARKAHHEAHAEAAAAAAAGAKSGSIRGREGETKTGSSGDGEEQGAGRGAAQDEHGEAAHALIRHTSFNLTENIVADAMRRSTSYRRRQMQEQRQ